jgi:hypothetical protein
VRALLLLALLAPVLAWPQEKTQTQEMTGRFGGRNALLYLHSRQREDGSWQMTGEYIVLPTLIRRYLDGERGPELGVTTLKESTSPILFGHPATGELQGRLVDGSFKGTRYGPGGQERERFEFTSDFPSMEGYSASVRCEAGYEGYRADLRYEIEAGKLKSFEWRAKAGANGQGCLVQSGAQEPAKGGLKFVEGRCSATLRDLGDFVKVTAEGCSAQCGSDAYLEPVIVDKRGHCLLLGREIRQ